MQSRRAGDTFVPVNSGTSKKIDEWSSTTKKEVSAVENRSTVRKKKKCHLSAKILLHSVFFLEFRQKRKKIVTDITAQ